MYPNIDVQKTGAQLKEKLTSAGYSVKSIQKYLHLSCPQPIYRWFKGQTLPTVDHLYALSKLLDVHMEELIVPYVQKIPFSMEYALENPTIHRLYCYYLGMERAA